MNLFIETENGATKNHPAFEENLIQAFGAIPEHWEPFNRVERPTLSVYQVLDSQEPTYQKIDGVWTDVWALRDMTAEEKTAKQNATKNNFMNDGYYFNHKAWVFNESICMFEPPTPMPSDGKEYFWQGITNSWVVMPEQPKDGQLYVFDFTNGKWIVFPKRPTDGKNYIFDMSTMTWTVALTT
jgi:hypothetical protein